MSAVLSHINDMTGYMLLALPVWAIIRTGWLKMRKKPLQWGREVLLAFFVVYLAGLASQTLTPAPGFRQNPADRLRWGWGVNLVPGRTILAYWRHVSLGQQLVNLAGNVLIFAPLGFLPPLLWKRLARWRRAVGLCFCVSLFIECAQLFVGRSVDVDDLILNTLGGLLGYLAFALVRRLKRKPIL